MSGPCTYQLLIEVKATVKISVGRLGLCRFPSGRYIYTGSAKRNLEARIARHLSREKRLHWHIDYLLLHPAVAVAGVRRFYDGECELNRHTPGDIPVAGFGASDCRVGCGSHLKFLGPMAQPRPETGGIKQGKGPKIGP